MAEARRARWCDAETRPDLSDLSLHFQLMSQAAGAECQEWDCVLAL